jgi:hypothetical protein
VRINLIAHVGIVPRTGPITVNVNWVIREELLGYSPISIENARTEIPHPIRNPIQ